MFALTLLFPIVAMGLDSSQDVEKHDVIAVYERIDFDNETLDENGDEIQFVLVKKSLKEGQYKIEIGNRINSNIYEVRGTNIYLKFRFPPFLYTFDEGVLDWPRYGYGTFYEID